MTQTKDGGMMRMTDKQKTGYETIVLGDMSERAATSVWEGVAGLATSYSTFENGVTNREDFERSLIEDERNYMINYHIDKSDMWVGEGKNHRLNKRKYLPSKYRTAKSVAANCLEHSVKMHDSDGNVLAKSKCEASIKLAKRANTSAKLSVVTSDMLEVRSDYEKAFSAISQARRYVKLGGLDSREIEVLREDATKLIDVINAKEVV